MQRQWRNLLRAPRFSCSVTSWQKICEPKIGTFSLRNRCLSHWSEHWKLLSWGVGGWWWWWWWCDSVCFSLWISASRTQRCRHFQRKKLLYIEHAGSRVSRKHMKSWSLLGCDFASLGWYLPDVSEVGNVIIFETNFLYFLTLNIKALML